MTPSELIKKKLEDKGWTQRDLAQVLGRPLPNVNEIINGKTAITPETAIKLSEAFGDDPEEWMLAESRYRLSLVDGSDDAVKARADLFDAAPVKDMQKRNWIGTTKTADDLRIELQRFFESESIADAGPPGLSARKTDGVAPLTSPQRAWAFCAWKMARSVPAKPFTEKRFQDGLAKLKVLAAWPEETRHVPTILGDMGIRLVIVEPLPRSKIDGVAIRPPGEAPIIALSMRHDRIDNFWHTLGHELSHIRHQDAVHVDENLVGDQQLSPAEQNEIECRANWEAATMWVSESDLNDFILRVSPLYSRKKINGFASRIKVHPGIIVGQLQHRGEISYGSHRPTLVKVRNIVTSSTLTDGWGHVVPFGS